MWTNKVIIVALCLVFSLTLVNCIYEDYSDYKKYTIEHISDDIYKYMVELQTSDNELDFWLITRNMSIAIAPPHMQIPFEIKLNEIGAKFNAAPLQMHNEDVQDENCQNDGDDGNGSCPLKRRTRQAGFFSHFQRHSTILTYMYNLARKYPSVCRFESNGRSSEGRSIGMLAISLNRHRSRKLAYIQGGAHAREWISPTTVLYFAAELLANINHFRSLLRDTDVYIVPVVNPDGYEYSHTHNRLWRKNRRYFVGHACRGVDINRNFGFAWNYVGSSQNLCSEVYSGNGPNSEPETQWVKHFLDRNRGRVKLVLDVHSFGKFLFYPWGYTRRSAPTRNFLHRVAQRAAAAIYKYRGTVYSIGSSSNLLYEASGGLDDYAYGVLGVPLSYTMELPGSGFEISSREIVPIGRETFAGIIEFISVVADELDSGGTITNGFFQIPIIS